MLRIYVYSHLSNHAHPVIEDCFRNRADLMEKFDVCLDHLQPGRSRIESCKPIEREGQYKHGKIEFRRNPSYLEMDFTPVEFSTLTNARLLENIHLSRAVGTFPADNFIFDADVSDFMAVLDEQFPDSFGSESLFSGMFEVRLKILVDLLADNLSEDARRLDDLPVLRQDLFSFSLL